MDFVINLDQNYSTTKLLYKIIDDKCLMLDKDGRIKEECKFNINIPTLNIQNSKFIAKPEDKFETMLFLPEGEGRKGEGGLRTKGYFKFSYVKRGTLDVKPETSNPSPLTSHVSPSTYCWYIADFDGNPLIPAHPEAQEKIEDYISSLGSNKTPNTHHPSMLTSLPLITIITVVYNGAKYLEETIQSVINQTYPNVEYIIIDGGSTDGTLDIIKKYEDYIDYWVSEKDKGIYDAMNKALSVSQGEWIGFLGSDDILLKDSIMNYVDFINKISSDVEFISAKVDLINQNYKIVRTIGNAWSWEIFRKYMNIAHVASLHKIRLFKKYGFFDVSFKIAADYEFLLRVKNNLKALFLDKKVALMRCDGASNRNIITVLNETRLIKLKYSDRSELLINIDFVVAFMKYLLRRILWY